MDYLALACKRLGIEPDDVISHSIVNDKDQIIILTTTARHAISLESLELEAQADTQAEKQAEKVDKFKENLRKRGKAT